MEPHSTRRLMIYLHRMVIKINSIKILAIILLPGFIFSCNGCKSVCIAGSVAINLNGGIANFSPEKDSITVGDTLWFTASVPTQIKYKPGSATDSVYYNLSGASDVTAEMHFNAIPQKATLTNAVDSFIYIKRAGNFSPNKLTPHGSEVISFIEQNGNYEFSFGLIAQKKGFYCLTVIDIYQAKKKCDQISVSIMVKNAITHLYYLKNLYYNGGPIDSYSQTHSYCFKVY